MKALLFTLALGVVATGAAEARSILTFKTVYKCVLADAPLSDELVINVQEAQDGQSQLVVKFLEDREASKIQTVKILPPPMMAGGSIKYEGRFTGMAGQLTTLAITSRPRNVEGVKGRAASFTVDQLFDKLPMICTFVK